MQIPYMSEIPERLERIPERMGKMCKRFLKIYWLVNRSNSARS